MQLSHEKEVAKSDNPMLAVFSPIRIDRSKSSVIEDMTSNTVTDIAAGDAFSMFVTKNNSNKETEVFGCGLNINGELGVGYLRHVLDVTKVEALSNFIFKENKDDPNIRVDQISCGKNHCVALLNIGAVLEWGSNLKGQLGNKKRVPSENPLIISRLQKKLVKSISCGYDSTSVIVYDLKADK